ncbi:MAG: helix-turn-helix domain-containing protein [bacterium]
MNAEQFGVRVRERRSQEGLSQDDLAQKTGISRNYLSQIERGQAENISLEYIKRIVIALGMDIAISQHGLDENTQDDETQEVLPPGLRDFALEEGLAPADVKMLAQLNYRGNRPDTKEKWKMLYKIIKSVLE